MEEKQRLFRVAYRVEECCGARVSTIQKSIDTMLRKTMNAVSSLDHRCSKAIQKYTPLPPVRRRMKLSDDSEHALAIPALLFGRHCVPFLIVLSFLLLHFHYACYYSLSW